MTNHLLREEFDLPFILLIFGRKNFILSLFICFLVQASLFEEEILVSVRFLVLGFLLFFSWLYLAAGSCIDPGFGFKDNLKL